MPQARSDSQSYKIINERTRITHFLVFFHIAGLAGKPFSPPPGLELLNKKKRSKVANHMVCHLAEQ